MKTRNPNLELLRIFSMFLIIFIHANVFLSRFCQDFVSFTFFNGLVNGICNIGVTCFVLISGYFGINFESRKLIKLECMMISLSLLETALLCIVFPQQMQGAVLLEMLVKSCFPVISRKYWFYSCYVILMLLSKWLHHFIDRLEEKDFKKLLFLLLFLFSILPTFFYFEIIPDNGKGLTQMIMLYLLGRYIRKYRDISLPKLSLAVFLLLWLVNGISHEISWQIGGVSHHFCKDNSITNIIMAVILFYNIKNINIRANWINKAAAGLFAAFALNNTFITIVMHFYEKTTFAATVGGIGGFLMLAAIVLLILIFCLLISGARRILLDRLDQTIIIMAEKLLDKANRTFITSI